MHLSLQHVCTTQELAVLNRQLDEVLLSTPVNDTFLATIIDERANLVESLLNSLHPEQRKRFASFEIKSNDIIIAAVDKHRNETKAELSKINKASKAIKKYQQV